MAQATLGRSRQLPAFSRHGRISTLSRDGAAPFIELATALGLDTEASFDEQIVAKLKAI